MRATIFLVFLSSGNSKILALLNQSLSQKKKFPFSFLSFLFPFFLVANWLPASSLHGGEASWWRDDWLPGKKLSALGTNRP